MKEKAICVLKSYRHNVRKQVLLKAIVKQKARKKLIVLDAVAKLHSLVLYGFLT